MRSELPILWLVLPVLLAMVWWFTRRSYAQLVPWARRASTIIRVIIVILLVAALVQPEVSRQVDRTHVSVVLDVSQSVSPANVQAAIDATEGIAAQLAEEDTPVMLIASGQQARIIQRGDAVWTTLEEPVREQLLWKTAASDLAAERAALLSENPDDDIAIEALTQRLEAVEQMRDTVAGDHTDLQRALRVAINSAPPDAARTIYILTDGQVNRGDHPLGDTAAIGDARIIYIALDEPTPPEVAATQLTVPPRVRVHQTFAADLQVASSTDTEADISVYRDGFLVHEQRVTLARGDNTILIPGLYYRDKGFHTIEAVVRAEADTELDNNTISTLSTVPGEAKVLYVDGEEALAPYLKGALELEGMQVQVRPAIGVPTELSDLLSYDVLILSNVPADRMSMRQMQMIDTYVRDFGGGFIMLGGDESFGLGGYFQTPVEDILPVQMPIQKDLLRPSLALCLVIDKSGSMSGAKIQLAKRAAIATADAINPRDQIGVIGFDGDSRIILELTPAGDRATIANRIATLDAGGGTFLFPALEDARDQLQQSNARKKHVIILSDGQTQGFGYEDLAHMMALEGTTISTVGIGEGADMQLMENMAMSGGGRAYFTNDFQSIPRIFTREALRASKNMLIERLVVPMATDTHTSDILNDIDTDDLPLLSGYVATTPRAAADVLLISDSGDPLLAAWRCGLGRTAAFTSDTKPRWAEDWLQWPTFARFWAQVVRSVAGYELGETVDLDLTHRIDRDSVVLTAEARTPTGAFAEDIDLSLATFVDERPTDVPVEQIGPGLYEARMKRQSYGEPRQFAWQLEHDQAQPRVAPYGFIAATSPELRTLGIDDDFFRRARETPGTQVRTLEQAATVETASQTGRRWVMLWPVLLTLAVLLMPLDILVRRMG